MAERSNAVLPAQAARALCAASMAALASAAPPSGTWPISSPLAGLVTGKVRAAVAQTPEMYMEGGSDAGRVWDVHCWLGEIAECGGRGKSWEAAADQHFAFAVRRKIVRLCSV